MRVHQAGYQWVEEIVRIFRKSRRFGTRLAEEHGIFETDPQILDTLRRALAEASVPWTYDWRVRRIGVLFRPFRLAVYHLEAETLLVGTHLRYGRSTAEQVEATEAELPALAVSSAPAAFERVSREFSLPKEPKPRVCPDCWGEGTREPKPIDEAAFGTALPDPESIPEEQRCTNCAGSGQVQSVAVAELRYEVERGTWLLHDEPDLPQNALDYLFGADSDAPTVLEVVLLEAQVDSWQGPEFEADRASIERVLLLGLSEDLIRRRQASEHEPVPLRVRLRLRKVEYLRTEGCYGLDRLPLWAVPARGRSLLANLPLSPLLLLPMWFLGVLLLVAGGSVLLAWGLVQFDPAELGSRLGW